MSACGALAAAYPRAPAALRPELRALFAQLCRDETPMVRRAAAQHLAKVAAAVEPEAVSQEFVPHFLKLTQDGAWHVRRVGSERLSMGGCRPTGMVNGHELHLSLGLQVPGVLVKPVAVSQFSVQHFLEPTQEGAPQTLVLLGSRASK